MNIYGFGNMTLAAQQEGNWDLVDSQIVVSVNNTSPAPADTCPINAETQQVTSLSPETSPVMNVVSLEAVSEPVNATASAHALQSIATLGWWRSLGENMWEATSEKVGAVWSAVITPVVSNPTTVSAVTAIAATEAGRRCYTNYQNRNYKHAAAWGAASLVATVLCVNTILKNQSGTSLV